ncbi:MAG: hypothetical protein IJ548_07190 [Paludibacteraceae bacterium]|nr:hypothetical protein [Paludibacteraceae bacterium]
MLLNNIEETMYDWEEISFKEIEGKGLFKFTYLFNGTDNFGDPWAECIENDEYTDIYAQDLLIKLQNTESITQLKAFRAIAEYE